MNIVVCLHAPPAPDAVEPGAAPLGLDDAHALALALALGPAHAVTALLAGPPGDEAPLRRALAAGVTRAVRLTGEDFGSADFHTLGQAIATGLKRVGGDLVLAGARSEDDGLGAVPASVARHWRGGVVHVACIESLVAVDGDAVEISVRGGGRRRRLRVPLPAVLSVVASGPDAPALPTERADTPAIEVLSLVDPEATVVRRRTELLGQPELPSRACEEVTSADALVAALARR
jgi:electron transfer flavoprotein alpha/beta subunit